MSKFIFSNNKNIAEQIVSDSCSVGFEVSGLYDDVVSYRSFYKLSRHNCNFYAVNDDFLSVVGTCIYKGMHGKEALIAIYNDFDSDINAIRDQVIGNCAIIIKKSNYVHIFGEYFGLYDIYFYNKNGVFVVSHDLYDLYKSVQGLTINKLNMLEHLALGANYCGETIFDDVFRLQDNEILKFNVLNGNLEKITFPVEWKCSRTLSYSECISEISATLKSIGKSFCDNFGVPALSSTGGLDNRLNLATFLANDIKPDLYYGIGNSGATNTFPGDLKVNQEFEKLFGTKLHQVSWNNSNPINKDWNELKNKYGFNSVCYAGSKDFFDAYENIPNSAILFGYMGELYRNLDVWEARNFIPMTLDEYIDKYLICGFFTKDTKLYNEVDSIRLHLHSKLLETCKKWNINPNIISADDDFFLNLERRRCSDVALLNLMNYHHYCAYLICNYSAIQIVEHVKAKDKLYYKFQLDILKTLCSEVLQIPIFSHCRFQNYNSKTNTLKDYRSLYGYLKSIIPKEYHVRIKSLFPSKIMNMFNKKYLDSKKNIENKFDLETNKVVNRILSKIGLIENVDYSTLVNGRLNRDIMRFAQELYILGKINNNNYYKGLK